MFENRENNATTEMICVAVLERPSDYNRRDGMIDGDNREYKDHVYDVMNKQ